MIRQVSERPPQSLESDARKVVADLQRAVGQVVLSLPGPPTRPRDLVNRLGVHHSLAWKITRIASGVDPMGNARFIPGRGGMEQFLRAAVREGVDQAIADRAGKAFDQFRQMVDSHAGDRPSLDLMLSNLANDPDASADQPALRRAAYLCNSATWGVQVRTRLLAKILHPSGGAADWDGSMDIALLRLFGGMRRVRPGAPLVLSRAVTVDNDGKARRTPSVEPLDVNGGVDRLIPRFCSHPVPAISTLAANGGITEQRVEGGALGERGAITICTGEVQRRAASAFADAHNTASRTAVEVRMPIATLVIDVWAHASICAGAAPRAYCYSEVSGVPWYRQPRELLQELPIAEEAQTLGAGLAAAPLPGLPHYEEMIQHAFASLGWDPSEHTLHRLRIDFPVLATAAVLEFPLARR